MKPTKNKALFSVMAVILLLTACVPATQPQPTQDPVTLPTRWRPLSH